MGHDMRRAGNGQRAGRQEVQHTHRSKEQLKYLAERWELDNASDVVREALSRAAFRLGWRPKP